ncbi:MAG: thiamine diphosphokinase [Opitutales bacterium]
MRSEVSPSVTQSPSKILIVLGGSPPDSALLREHFEWSERSIAADSGLDSFKNAGLSPDVAIGDFDSFHGDPHQFAKQVISAPEQNATDFQKALRMIDGSTPELEITILGGTGRRADHFLTNLLIVAEKWPEAAFTFHDLDQSIYRVSPQKALEMSNCSIGSTVSLIPMSRAAGVTTQGLHWELTDASMEPNGQLGQSNVQESEILSISIRTGALFVIINRNLRD